MTMTDSTSSFSKFSFDFNRVTKVKRMNIKKNEKSQLSTILQKTPAQTIDKVLNTPFYSKC